MMNKKETMKLNTYQQMLGYFYAHLIKTCKKEVEDIDLALQDLLDIQAEDTVDSENLYEAQRTLQDRVRHCLGMFAVKSSGGYDYSYRYCDEEDPDIEE